LLDSPGIIQQEKYSNMNKNLMIEHAKIGARDYTNLKEPDLFVLKIMEENPGLLEGYYEIDNNLINKDPEKLIETLGLKKGFLRKGGFIDEDKVSR
jgi:ribosome biogenesis GTPase A